MSAINNPVVSGVNLLEGGGGVEGQVIRVILPPGSGLTSESIQATIWKTQIKQLGFARCVHEGCRISFLSVKGMEAHLKTCKGLSNPGDFVLCPGCGERFKTFSTMAKHHVKLHGCTVQSVVTSRPQPFVDDNMPQTEGIVKTEMMSSPTEISIAATTSDFDVNLRQDEFDLPSDIAFESREALRDRIMAESRQISTARPRGRPRKSSSPTKDFSMPGHQYKDTFDIEDDEILGHEDARMQHVQFVQLQSISDSFKQINSMELPRRAQPSSSLDLIQMRTMDGKIVWVKKAIVNVPSTYEPSSSIPSSTQVRHKFEDDLAAKEAKLANYQNLVIKYEHLAEQATKMAMEERSNQLIHYEEELKRRELEAKKKLAGAVEVLQQIQSGNQHSPDPKVPASVSEVETRSSFDEACSSSNLEGSSNSYQPPPHDQATILPNQDCDESVDNADQSIEESGVTEQEDSETVEDTEIDEDTEIVEMEIVIPDMVVTEQFPIEHYEMVEAVDLNSQCSILTTQEDNDDTSENYEDMSSSQQEENIEENCFQQVTAVSSDESVYQFEQDSSSQHKEQFEENGSQQVTPEYSEENAYQFVQESSSQHQEQLEENYSQEGSPESSEQLVCQSEQDAIVAAVEISSQSIEDMSSSQLEENSSQQVTPQSSEETVNKFEEVVDITAKKLVPEENLAKIIEQSSQQELVPTSSSPGQNEFPLESSTTATSEDLAATASPVSLV